MAALDLNKVKMTVPITLPIALKFKADQYCEENDISTANFFRQAIAEKLGVKVEDYGRGRAKKYASEEERKEALKKAAQERREKIKAIMKQLSAGEIDMDAFLHLENDEDDDD